MSVTCGSIIAVVGSSTKMFFISKVIYQANRISYIKISGTDKPETHEFFLMWLIKNKHNEGD